MLVRCNKPDDLECLGCRHGVPHGPGACVVEAICSYREIEVRCVKVKEEKT
jgi:hypothetical protein